MKATLLVLMFAAGLVTRAEAQISLDFNLDSRASFEALAERAGLNVVFLRSFRPTVAAPFHAENMSATDALDLLAKQTSTFWVSWDKKNILVLEDTPVNRRDYERQFVASLPLGTRSQSGVIEDLRGRGFRQVAAAGPGNSIFVRDTAAQIRRAESAIANPNEPAILDLDGVYFTENNMQWRTPESARAQLKAKATEPLSLNVNESSRTTFETLAKNAGVNILFGRNFRPSTVRFVVKNVGFFDALDLLSIATSTFWQPVNDNTFLVMEDNQQNRRDFERHSAETIYLPSGVSTSRLNEILNSLRTMLALRGIFQNESANAIFIHDTPGRVILAEAMIATMTGAPVRKKPVTDLRTAFSENSGGSFYAAASDRASLQIKTAPISFSMDGTSREAFDKLASVAGLQLVFKANFRSGGNRINFTLQDVDVIEAIDLLALQTGTFWQPLDTHTILVIEDNQQNRRDYLAHLVKTIYLPRETTTSQLNGVINLLRTAMGMRGVFQNEDAKAMVIHDTPQRIALAETIIEHLNTFPIPARALSIPAPRYAENGIFGVASTARNNLRLKASGPVSVNLNQDPRTTYEALADIAGIQINFSPDFPPGIAAPFHLEGVDILDALDYLSLATGNSWTVVDAQTIQVLSGIRRDLEPPLTKTFYIVNKASQNTVNGIANLLRTAMGMRDVQIGDGAITIQDTPQRMAIAEKIIASLDRTP